MPVLFSEKIILFICLLLAVLGLHCWAGFSLAVAGRGYSLVVVNRLLISVASLAVECGREGPGASVVVARGLKASGPGLYRLSGVAHEFSCSVTCGIFPDQESTPCLLQRQVILYH